MFIVEVLLFTFETIVFVLTPLFTVVDKDPLCPVVYELLS